MRTRLTLSILGMLLCLSFTDAVHALCLDGSTSTCSRNGCQGIRQCIGGRWSACESTGIGPACSVCGRSGRTTCDEHFNIIVNSCAANEICNACDDNLNGLIDEGLIKCAFGPFTQIACPVSPDTIVPYRFDTSDITANQSSSVYQSNTDFSWTLVTNPLVRNVRLQFDAFTTELGPDTLTVTGFEVLSGVVPAGLRSYLVNGNGQASGIQLRFISNGSVTFPGFTISQARLACGASGSTVEHQLPIQTPVHGLLAGTDDTIFFRFPGEPNRLYLVLEGTATVDIDLYVNSGARPEKNVYVKRSVGPGSMEAVALDRTSGQTLFAAVTAANGAGSFRLRLLRSTEGHELHAGLGFAPGPGDMARLEAMIEEGQRRFFGMTEGEIVVEKINLHRFVSGGPFGGCDCGGYHCDICIYSRSGRAHYNALNNEIVLYAEDWDDGGRVLAHELGHKLLGLPDEYNDHNDNTGKVCHGDDLCGHTAMSKYNHESYAAWDPMIDSTRCGP